MPELLAADGAVISTAPAFDKERADAEFTEAMITEPSGDLPPRPEQAAPEVKRRGRKPKAEQPRVTAAASSAKPLGRDDRRQGVKAIAQLGAVIPLMLARATGKDAYKADAVAISSSADDIADACADVADVDPRFAAALDRVCQVGPYGALITIAFEVGGQILRNHRPGLAIPGTVHPSELLAAVQQQAA